MPPEPPRIGGRDQALLLDMLVAAQDAIRFAAGQDESSFLADDYCQSAVIRKLAVIGEAAGKIDLGVRTDHPDIPWREIIGLRHRLIHGYADVRLDVVWSIVAEMAPRLVARLGALVPHEGKADGG